MFSDYMQHFTFSNDVIFVLHVNNVMQYILKKFDLSYVINFGCLKIYDGVICYFIISSWCYGINKQLEHRLQVTQNKEVRFILSLSPRDSISGSVLNYLDMLTVEDRVAQLRLNHVLMYTTAMHQHILMII